jgi:apolipoprotein N-acyltransferase
MLKTLALRPFLNFGASVLAGGLLFLALPVFPFPFLGWMWLVPALWAAIFSETDRRSFLHGLVTGMVFSIPAFHWLIASLRSFLGLSLPAALVLFLFLCLWQALFFAAASVLLRVLHRRTKLPFALIAPVTLVALEFVLPFIVPWSLACSQAFILPILQLAEITGPLGISFCLGMVSGALFDALLALSQGRALPRRPILGAALILLLVLGFGFGRMRQIDQRWASAPKVKVGVVQSNIRADLRPQIYRGGHFTYGRAEQLRQSAMRKQVFGSALLKNQGAQLIVWPESAYPWALAHNGRKDGGPEPEVRLTFPVPILFGAMTTDADRRFWNSALLLDPSGSITGRYDKKSLFLLGERIPLVKTFSSLRQLLPPGAGQLEPGTRLSVLALPDPRAPGGTLRLGPLICLEDLLPLQAAALSRQHPQALVALGNDGWFGQGSEPWEHLALSVFRSVEQRTALVRAAQTGVSGFIDATGRVKKRLLPTDPPDAETTPVGTLLDDVALLEAGHTFYATVGSLWGRFDLLGLLMLGALAYLLFPAGWRRRLPISDIFHSQTKRSL